MKNRMRWAVSIAIAALIGTEAACAAENAIRVRPGAGNPIQKAVDEALAREPIPEIIVHAGAYPGGVEIKGGKPGRLVIRAERKPDGGFVDAIVDGARKITEADRVPGKSGVYRVTHRFPSKCWPSLWELDTGIRYNLVANTDTAAAREACFGLGDGEVYFQTSDGKAPAAHDLWMSRDDTGLHIRRNDVTVQGLQFRGFHMSRRSAGVRLDNGTGHVVEDCRVWGAVRGIDVTQRCEGPRIRRCRADDVVTGVFSNGKGEIIEDCIFIRRENAFEVQCYSQDQAGIEHYYPYGGGEAYRNLIVGFAKGIFYKAPPARYVVEYNTAVGRGGGSGIGCTGWHSNSVFRYNVATGFGTALLWLSSFQGSVVDKNVFFRSPRTAPWEGPENVREQPRFANPEHEDYRLLPDSPGAQLGEGGRSAGALGVADGEGFTRAILPVVGAADVKPPPILRLPATDVQHIEREGPPRCWHVNPERGAESAGGGTAERPFRSLQDALNRANPGDRVVLAPGVYLGEHALEHGGTAEAPIVIEAAEPHTAVLDGLNRADVCLKLKNAPYVTVKGLELRWYLEAGIQVADSPHARIEGCRIWNKDRNTSGRVIGKGIFLRGSPDALITKNVLFMNDRSIVIQDSPRFSLTYNTLSTSFHGCLSIHRSAAGSVCRNNSLTFPGNGVYFGLKQDEMKAFDCDYNNLLFYLRADYAARKPPPPGEHAKPFKGDPFGAGTKGLAYVEPGGYITSMSEWRNWSGADRHSIFLYPKYVDPRSYDYRLAPDSPNIGAGENGTTIGALGPDSAPPAK
ncbi:MAG: right-handed parallel beta-helix repeat-containing protein [Kiritimatiellae bacterium]|nr:right-handed parallel beta-helix repeat-containing protein [Kiritimatiellia bacterium]